MNEFIEQNMISGTSSILVVEDNLQSLRMIEEFLSDMGFDISVARSGKSAIDRAKIGSPNLILLDIMLPDISGFEVCEALKLDEATRNIPIIFMTALDKPEDILKGFQAGAVDYVTKPVNQEILLVRINAHIKLYNLTSQLEQMVAERTNKLRISNEQLKQEIAERRIVEKALRQSESKLKRAQSIASLGDWTWKNQTDKVSWSEEIFTILGQSSGYDPENLAVLIEECVHPDDKESVIEATKTYIIDQNPQPIEYRIIRSDGEIRWVWAQAADRVLDENGQLIQMSGILQDITERKNAETVLLQLNQALEQSPVSVIITDTKGTIQYVNSKFTEVSGYDEQDVIGKNPRILKSGQHSASFYKEMWDTIISGEEWRNEVCNKKKNGELYWELVSIAGVKDSNGKISNYVAVKEDITQRKQLEEEKVRQERLAAVGQLAAGIAHDFNNIMAIITLDSDLILRTVQLSNSEQGKLKRIQKQAFHATKLTKQILDFSRRSAREPKILDLRVFLDEILEFITRTIPERIQIQFTYADGEYIVKADPTQLQQIITNLALNARDAMSHTGKLNFNLSRMVVHKDHLPDPMMELGEWVKLVVADNGSGIHPDVINHIFEPFFTTKDVGKGTGLGLAQVYGIVQQNEGHITVSSQLKQGTTFEIYLPAVTQELNHPHESNNMAAFHGQGETILLVEDNPDLLESTKSTLRLLDYQILSAMNGNDALEVYFANENQINLVMTDVVMPQMDGFQLVRALRKHDSKLKILLMSGFPLDTEMYGEIKDGKASWLQKPADISQLATVLRELLDKNT